MKTTRKFILPFIPLVIFYCAYQVLLFAGAGTGGIGTSPGVGSASSITTGTLPQAQGGWGPVSEEGTITNGGTVTCGTNAAANWRECHFTVASGASFTMANPINLPANAHVWISFTQAGTGLPGITWGTHFLCWSPGTSATAACQGQAGNPTNLIYTNATTGDADSMWKTDSTGTNLTLDSGPQQSRTDSSFTETGVNGKILTGIAAMWSGGSATITAAATDFIAFGQNPAQAVIATAANAFSIAPHIPTGSATLGTAADLECYTTTACQAGGVVFTVMGGAAGTTAETLTCTCGAAATTCADTSHTFTVNAADLLSIRVVNSNAANATGNTGCAFMING